MILKKPAGDARGFFSFKNWPGLKFEGQTCHDVEGRLCVVVRKIAPHVSISCIGGVA